jgi:membrane-associated protein
LCGIVKIPARKFLLWNVIGGIIWTESVLFVGYILGEKLKGSVDAYILPIVGIIIFVSLIPVAIELFREWRTKRHLS